MQCATLSLQLFVPPSSFGLLEGHKLGWSTRGTGLLPASHSHTRLSSRQLSRTIRPHSSCARPGRDMRSQRLRYHVVMTVTCYLFYESSAARHVTVMSACDVWSSVCTESVHSTVCHCACVAQIITVGSSAHVQAIELLNEHHPVFRALDVLASKCLVDESTSHSQDHPFLTHI